MVIEAKKIFFICLVVLKLFFKSNWVTAIYQISRTAVMACSITVGGKGFNMDTILMIVDGLSVILSAAVSASHFVLFNVDEDIVW